MCALISSLRLILLARKSSQYEISKRGKNSTSIMGGGIGRAAAAQLSQLEYHSVTCIRGDKQLQAHHSFVVDIYSNYLINKITIKLSGRSVLWARHSLSVSSMILATRGLARRTLVSAMLLQQLVTSTENFERGSSASSEVSSARRG